MSRIFACLILMALAACASRQPVEHVGEVTPIMGGNFSQTRSFVYQRAIVKPDRGAPAATVMGGLACIPQGQLAWDTGQFGVVNQEYENAVQEEFQRAGYRIAATVGGGDLFSDKREIATDYRIAAVITDVRANICYPMSGFGDFYRGSGEASLRVEWQVYSDREKRVVMTSVQKGSAKIDGMTPAAPKALLLRAFARSVRGLLADPAFAALGGAAGC